MGEFVESSLEDLLPVFEQLSHVQLFTPAETNAFVKMCRRFEYRLQKRAKSPEDFLLYANYLNDFFALLRSRRARVDYFHKTKLIEKPLLMKITSIYRRCCDRFSSQMDLWKTLFSFLKKHKLRKDLSQAYTRALAVHGRDMNLRIAAANFEFFNNNSADNARTLIQLALRQFPGEHRLYSTWFCVECNYVKKIIKRRDFMKKVLLNEKKETKEALGEDYISDEEEFNVDDVDDAVLQLKTAELILNVGLRSVSDDVKGEMLLSMWKAAKECIDIVPAAGRVCELVEEKLGELNDESTELLEIEKTKTENSKVDLCELYDAAILKCPTEKMHRLYIDFCMDEIKKDNPLAEMKLDGLRKILMDKGWADEKEMKLVVAAEGFVSSPTERMDILEKALKTCPSSDFYWRELLGLRMENESFEDKRSIATFLELINDAFDKVPADSSFPIWELALDFVIKYAPSKVEDLFSKAMRETPCAVSSRIKIIRLDYMEALAAEGLITETNRTDAISRLMDSKPNTAEFYNAVGRRESDKGNSTLARMAYELSVAECGGNTVSAWIEFAKYALRHDASLVATLYKRAMINLEPSVVGDFVIEWTRVLQEAANSVADKTNKSSKADYTIASKRKSSDSQEQNSEKSCNVTPAVQSKRKRSSSKEKEDNVEKVEIKSSPAKTPPSVKVGMNWVDAFDKQVAAEGAPTTPPGPLPTAAQWSSSTRGMHVGTGSDGHSQQISPRGRGMPSYQSSFGRGSGPPPQTSYGTTHGAGGGFSPRGGARGFPAAPQNAFYNSAQQIQGPSVGDFAGNGSSSAGFAPRGGFNGNAPRGGGHPSREAHGGAAQPFFPNRTYVNPDLLKTRSAVPLPVTSDPEDAVEKPMTPEEVALLNKFLHKTVNLMKNDQVDVVRQQADPRSPLHSVLNFRDLRIKDELLRALDLMGFQQPSKIQEFALPLLLMEPPTNMIAQSQSGTGKTAAFVIAMLSRVVPEHAEPQCLCLAPTYELAMQIGEVVRSMARFMPDVKVHFAVKGAQPARGVPLTEQIVIGTPGKMMDYLGKLRVLEPSKIGCLVLDEADVMISQQGHLDLSYRIYKTIEAASNKVQTMLFSATYEQDVMEFAEGLIRDAVSVTLKREDQALPNIKQYYVECASRDAKYQAVCDLYSGLVIASAVIFTHTKSSASWLAESMLQKGHEVALLHGDMTVEERALSIERFKDGDHKVLVTTNVCARGIDVSQVSIVINYDPPILHESDPNREPQPDYDTYLHRIGRTGRFGKAGIAINFVDSMRALGIIKKIEAHFGKSIGKLDPSDMEQLEAIDRE